MQELMSELHHTYNLITKNKDLGKRNSECEQDTQRRRNLSKYVNVKPRPTVSQTSPHSKYSCHGDDPQVKSHLMVPSKENQELGNMNIGNIQNFKNKRRFKMKKGSKFIIVPSRYMQFYQKYKHRGAKNSAIRRQKRTVNPAQLGNQKSQNQMSTQQLGFLTHQKSPFQHMITQTINETVSKEERNFTVGVNDVQEMRAKLKPIGKQVSRLNQNGDGLDQGSTSRRWTSQTDSASNRRNVLQGNKLRLTSRAPNPNDQAPDFRKVEFELPKRIKKENTPAILSTKKSMLQKNQVKPSINKQSFKKTIECVSRYNNNAHLGTLGKKNEGRDKSFGQKYINQKSFHNKKSNKVTDKIKLGTPLLNKQQATKSHIRDNKVVIGSLIMKNKVACPVMMNEQLTPKLKETRNKSKNQVQTPVIITNLIRNKFMERLKINGQTGILESKPKKNKKKNIQVTQKQTIGVKKMPENKNKFKKETGGKITADNRRYKTNMGRTYSKRFEQWCKIKHPELKLKLKSKHPINTRKNNELKTHQKMNKVNDKLKNGAKNINNNKKNNCTGHTRDKKTQEQRISRKGTEKKQTIPSENISKKYSLKRTKPAPCLNPKHLEMPEKMSPLPMTFMNMMQRYTEDVLKLNTIAGEVSIRVQN